MKKRVGIDIYLNNYAIKRKVLCSFSYTLSAVIVWEREILLWGRF